MRLEDSSEASVSFRDSSQSRIQHALIMGRAANLCSLTRKVSFWSSPPAEAEEMEGWFDGLMVRLCGAE